MTTISDIEDREDALRSAMLAGDVAALSSLIDDGLVFTGPDGNVLGKEQDVAAHASGILKLSRIDLFDGQVHSLGEMVLVTTKARLVGTFAGATIHGTYAYSRFWAQRSGDWRVVAGHAARIG